MNTKPIAIIPARGGSKRVPRKNVIPFFGNPLLSYTVAAAHNSKLFSRVIVSSDDEEIGKVGKQYGADFLKRPIELATDKSGLIEVAEHVLQELKKQGYAPDSFCQLMPNIPLRRAQDILDQHKAFIDGNRKFQISVMPYVGVYPHWALKRDAQGVGNWFFGAEFLIRSQELQATFCPTGAVWWANTQAFLEQKAFYGKPFHIEPMDPMRGIDIDTHEDLYWAEVITLGLQAKLGQSPLEPVRRPHDLRHPSEAREQASP